MSTHQDIYAASFENRPPMLNKDNYVPWSSRLLRYAKSKPNGKLLVNLIKNGLYVRRIIHEPGDPNSVPLVDESTHEQIDDELTEKEVKQMEADNQAIQTILMGLPKDIYVAVDSCDTTREIWLRVEQMMKGLIARNHNGYNAVHNVGNQIGQNAVQNLAARAEDNDSVIDCSKEEASIQLQAEEFDLMAAIGDIDEIEEVNANCILMANLQQASTLGTQTDKAPVYNSDETTEVHHNKNCYNNDIFNMFTQEEHMEHSGGTVEQHPRTVEETRAYFESLYNSLAIKVKKVNTVNLKMKEINAHLTTELARYRCQEKSFEINKEDSDELETGYRKSVYQEQCLAKKINALHLSFAKQITSLNEEIANLNNQLSKEKSIVSLLEEEKKRLKSDSNTREDELLDKQIQYEKNIKDLDNIMVKMGQSI
ncbi:hypothetical protein Tco_1010887 [Tanacetum coccineum]